MAANPARSKKLPLGIRLNNPGNIERTTPRTPWQGRVPDYLLTQSRFEEMTDPIWGIRMLARDLITKFDRGLNTVRKIISVYAPESENDTEAYIKQVSLKVRVHDSSQINLHDWETLNRFVRAIVRHENGLGPYLGYEWYTDDQYNEGLRRAGVVRPKSLVVTQSKTIQTASMAGIGGTVLGTSAVVDAANEAKSMLTPGTWLYIILTLIVVGCCVYMVYHRFKRAQLEGE